MISEDVKAHMRAICARYPTARSGMLSCLHLAQETEGYVSAEGIAAVAEATQTRADEVDSVVSFYSMYHREPECTYVINVCTSISCYLMGCDDLLEHLEDRLGIRKGESTPDGRYKLQGVECLAACGRAPALQVNGEFVENVTLPVADMMLDRLDRGESLAGMSVSWDVEGRGRGSGTTTTRNPITVEETAAGTGTEGAESPEKKAR
jgi:NADH-quinone oxidoreductase E subunit